DNSANRYSICSAYNEGAEKAKYDNLCFVHEDVVFRTNNWGQIALTEVKKFDLLGVAGSNYKSKAISGWASGSAKLDFGSVYHTKKN
ncbi:glycosyltransferase, partial [Acinetobacter baumannii]